MRGAFTPGQGVAQPLGPGRRGATMTGESPGRDGTMKPGRRRRR